ncbi:Qat anti-phage system TatD family nuclease QatD [Kordiimonas sp.]|uniref:Qat anti-phage system TatD family nuclease QatD n=1 Tax=Kordiimonas sp. TaxID=1970157 RepID=UPI003B51B802
MQARANLVDMHCHLDLYENASEQVKKIRSSGNFVLSVTTTPKAWNKTSALARNVKNIETALGLHPQLAGSRASELFLFEELLPQTRFVGEIGLDASREYRDSIEAQKFVFSEILKLSDAGGGKILSIHSREATDQVLDHLVDYMGDSTPILHWFSGTQKQLMEAVELGCWFSVGPAMLASEKGRRLAAMMPLDRILTETDGPFAKWQEVELQPLQVAPAISILSQLLQKPEVELRAAVAENLTLLLR